MPRSRFLYSPTHSGVGGLAILNSLHLLFYRAWAKKPYVDAKRIGIWGWVCSVKFFPLSQRVFTVSQSYGGFMSAKIAEADAKVHSLAMAVAVGVWS
jgi:dipeptidyl aminopeptidase